MVLIIDDEARAILTYTEELERAGIEFQYEVSVDKALEVIEDDNLKGKLELIILDIMMPGGKAFGGQPDEGRRTGVRLYQHIRAVLPNLPIIILTNVPRDRVAADLQLDDLHRYLQKTRNFPHEVAEVVSTILKSHQKEKE